MRRVCVFDVNETLLDLPVHVQFVLGVMGANAATIDQFMHMRRTATDLFGEDLTWSAAGVGYPAEYHLAAMFDREPAAPDEAREAFGLKGRTAVAF